MPEFAVESAIVPQKPEILWPERYQPAHSEVFAHNEIVIPATPEVIWQWLLRADDWPHWYRNAADIHFLSHAGPNLRNRSRFRWNTFGIRVTSKVLEFEPCRRLSWDAQGIGVHAYHAWLLTPLGSGQTHVLTEETQTGWLARLGHALIPKRMEGQHQRWLEALSVRAQSGPPTD